MLKLIVLGQEHWDEKKQEFVYNKEVSLQLEHSLVSLSKWEAKWKKPYLSREPLSYEETVDYIRCMTLTQNVDQDVYLRLTSANIAEVNRYIRDPMSAAQTRKSKSPDGHRSVMTSETIYADMVALGIPFECQKWHLNRLIALIRECDRRNRPPKKLSKEEIMKRNIALNMDRRKRLNTSG